MTTLLTRYPFITPLVGLSLLAGGCATSWKDAGVYYQSVQTRLSVRSSPTAGVYVDDRHLGNTPATTFLDCEQEVQRRTRNVSYWQTEPGYAGLLTVLSLGLYLPFSAIPADTETSTEATGQYKERVRRVRLVAEGYEPWEQTIPCGGIRQLELNPTLRPEPKRHE